jgi:hypothetical protein
MEISRLAPMEISDIDAVSQQCRQGHDLGPRRDESFPIQQHCHGEAGEHGGPAGPAHGAKGQALQDDRACHGHQHRDRRGDREGQAGRTQEDQGIARQGHQRAMGEIDHAQDREDDGEAQGQQGVGAPQAEGVDGLQDEIIHGACSRASSPPR